jgi:hypothetical protein
MAEQIITFVDGSGYFWTLNLLVGSDGTTVEAVTGEATKAGSSTITISHIDSVFDDPDNKLGSTSPYVDVKGISFDSTTGGAYNLFLNNGNIRLTEQNVGGTSVSNFAATPQVSDKILNFTDGNGYAWTLDLTMGVDGATILAVTGAATSATLATIAISNIDTAYGHPDNILGSTSAYVDVKGISFDSSTGAKYNLFLNNGDARISNAGVGGTSASNLTITTPACYLRGARMATPCGPVAIENLKIGDLVLTASGAARPVVWLGRRRIDANRHADPTLVWPVVVRAGAFGEKLPQRDLWLSPGHYIAFDGHLTPVGGLCNGASVEQIRRGKLEYWHVQLDAHDLILAEGLPAESYLDTGNRAAFENGGAFIEAHPDFAPRHWADTCLPLALDGPVVAAAKARLLARLAGRGLEIDHEAHAHILIDGLSVAPIRLDAMRLAFELPAGRRDVMLRSRAFTPAHSLADSDDPRRLGLCVGALQIDGAAVVLGRDGPCASGWHEAEYEGDRFTHRWTTGETQLPAGARIVIVDLAGVGHYLRQRSDKLAVRLH